MTAPDPVPAELAELAELARSSATEAAEELRRRADGPRAIDTKSTSTDLVTDADRAAEALLVERVAAVRPDDGILGEEAGERRGRNGVRWVVDPLDGTTNFVYGIPQYAVSIGIEIDGEPVVGVVVDVERRECFSAIRGEGARLDGRPITANHHDDLATALIGTGFAYDAELRADQGRALGTILPAVRDIRRAGSAALDLCWVACGRLDGYWERNLAAWDLAGGRVIATEAGAVVEHLDGGPPRPRDPVIAAGPTLLGPLRDLLRRAGA